MYDPDIRRAEPARRTPAAATLLRRRCCCESNLTAARGFSIINLILLLVGLLIYIIYCASFSNADYVDPDLYVNKAPTILLGIVLIPSTIAAIVLVIALYKLKRRVLLVYLGIMIFQVLALTAWFIWFMIVVNFITNTTRSNLQRAVANNGTSYGPILSPNYGMLWFASQKYYPYNITDYSAYQQRSTTTDSSGATESFDYYDEPAAEHQQEQYRLIKVAQTTMNFMGVAFFVVALFVHIWFAIVIAAARQEMNTMFGHAGRN